MLLILQALNALLFPINVADESTTQATQHKFITSGCISALLDAVNEGNNAGGESLFTAMEPASHVKSLPSCLRYLHVASPQK